MPTDRDLALVKAALEAASKWMPKSQATTMFHYLDPAAIVASQHICLNCGRTEPCTEAPDACTFDPTPQELCNENRRLRERIKELGMADDASNEASNG